MPESKYTINVDAAQATAALRQLRQDAAQTEATLKQLTAQKYTGGTGKLSVDDRAYRAEFEMNKSLERGIYIKQQAAQAYEGYKKQFPQLISGLEKQAALQGGSVIPSTVRLSTTTDTLTGKMVTHASAQTQLNNGLTGHVNTLDKASQGLSRYTSLLTKMAFSMIVWEGFQAVTKTIGDMIQAQRDYSLSTAQFAAVTEQSVGSAVDQWDRLSRVVAESGQKPSESGKTIRLASQLGTTPQEENIFTQVAGDLSKISGADIDDISVGLASIMKQLDIGVEGLPNIGDVITKTLQDIPAANIDQVMSALQEAPALASLWSTSWENAFQIMIRGQQATGEASETVANALSRPIDGINELAKGGEKAASRMEELRDKFGLNVIGDSGQLREPLEIMKEMAEIIPSLTKPQQQQIIELVAGASIKPDQLRTIMGSLEVLRQDLSGSFEGISGALSEGAGKVDSSFGQIVKVMDANLEILKAKGDVFQNLQGWLLSETVGKFGGAEGAKTVSDTAKMNSGEFAAEGSSMRDEFIKSLKGMTAEEAEKAIQDWNDRVFNATREQMLSFGLVPLPQQYQAATTAESSLKIDEAMKKEVIENLRSTGEQAGKGYVEGIKSAISGAQEVGNILSSILGKQGIDNLQRQVDPLAKLFFGEKKSETIVSDTTTVTAPPVKAPQTMMERLGARARATMFDQSGNLTGEKLDMGQADVSQYTQEQINTAKQMAIQLAQQEIQAQRELMVALEMQPAEIEKIIAAMQEEIDSTITLIQYQDKVKAEFGAQGKYLQDALRQMDQLEKKKGSDFQFKRLKDVDPSQFGQLQALTQMYDKFLTNIGSPEKKQNINLLLGEQNVFKTMNGRMTALAMALEDLTKVEKAQLSGTWNMPAGATALVPISSLDIQRWNKADSGGLSAEALMALMGATAESGDTVAQSQQEAATRIIQAIYDAMTREGLPTDKLKEAKTPAEAVKAAQEAVANRVNEATAWKDDILSKIRAMGGEKGSTPDLESITNLFKMVAQNASRPSGIGGRGLVGGGGGDAMGGKEKVSDKLSDMADKKAVPNVQVTVSSTPIKATFNANIMVNLNGYIVARALVPILFSMLTKTSASSGQRPQGVQR